MPPKSKTKGISSGGASGGARGISSGGSKGGARGISSGGVRGISSGGDSAGALEVIDLHLMPITPGMSVEKITAILEAKKKFKKETERKAELMRVLEEREKTKARRESIYRWMKQKIINASLSSLILLCEEVISARNYRRNLLEIKQQIKNYEGEREITFDGGEYGYSGTFGRYSCDVIKIMVINLYEANKCMFDEIKAIFEKEKQAFEFV